MSGIPVLFDFEFVFLDKDGDDLMLFGDSLNLNFSLNNINFQTNKDFQRQVLDSQD